MAVYFISDLHLCAERPAVTEAFLHFLENEAAAAETLYILGDLFEVWLGDDDPGETAQTVQNALKTLTGQGTRVYVIPGNRDFLLGKRFEQATGSKLLDDIHVVEHFGYQALIMHGDTLCIDDLKYQSYRRRIRNPIVRWLLAHLPLALRQKIAAEARARSVRENSNKPSEIMDVNTTEVARIMSRNDVRTLIHGHTHRPKRHRLSIGERLVLGDWHDYGWYIRLNQNGFALEKFAIEPTK